MPVDVGQRAPDFTLKDQAGNDVTLSAYRDKQNVVLVFYPFTFTGVCEGELCSLRSTRNSSGPRRTDSPALSSATSGRTAQWRASTASSTSSSGARTG